MANFDDDGWMNFGARCAILPRVFGLEVKHDRLVAAWMSGNYFPPDPCTCMKEEHSIIMTATNLGVADPARSTRPGGKAPATYIIAVSRVCRPVRWEIADLNGPVS